MTARKADLLYEWKLKVARKGSRVQVERPRTERSKRAAMQGHREPVYMHEISDLILDLESRDLKREPSKKHHPSSFL